MGNRNFFGLIFWLTVVSVLMSCSDYTASHKETGKNEETVTENWCVEGLTDFKRGDILVKPNLNFLPGSAQVPDGITFGHAVIVTEGYSHQNPDSLLSHIKIIESVSLDVPLEFQVRETNALVYDRVLAKRATSFDKRYTGFRYRLRLPLSNAQIDSIIDFARQQKGDSSCWNATKAFHEQYFEMNSSRKNWADNSSWYCSLLVWQAVYYVVGIDLDVNMGYEVYPNDLIANPIFDNKQNFIGRARF